MSKAEERALEKYPLLADDDKEALEALKYIGIECCASVYNEIKESKQAYFIEGYHQAEKDNELTWKDIEKMCLIAKEVHLFRGFWSESVYQEILERFKERKEE